MMSDRMPLYALIEQGILDIPAEFAGDVNCWEALVRLIVLMVIILFVTDRGHKGRRCKVRVRSRWSLQIMFCWSVYA